ncbi:hypothetical protein OH807_34110 [Kitasatospora sp. NBC_01560]|uniref:hypothetical protein n=1 Tax=Kitasatospora sp. NBC_01560 TaxID=2975965 RepID=UPI003870AC91
MLKPVRRITGHGLLVAGMLLFPATPAAADPTPDGGATRCEVNAICADGHGPGSTPTPGGGGGSGGGGGGTAQICSWNGQDWPCHDPVLGWFSSATGCYYTRTEPQPAVGAAAWQGHQPSEGSVYDETCRYPDGTQGAPEPKFFAQAPAAPPPDPAKLAQDARAKITFPVPKPRLAPSGTAVVGVPVWLWLDQFAVPAPGEASAGGITVRVTPRLASVEWDLGDGRTETCSGPNAAGTPYEEKYGAAKSPTCGHEFTTGSAVKAKGVFAGTVRANWVGDVTVTGSPKKIAPIDVPTFGDVTVKVAEVQVLN